MTIDLHIVISIVQLIVIALGGVGFVWTVKSRLDLLIQETSMRHQENSSKFTEIEKRLTELSSTTIEMVKQQIRMDHIDERLNQLGKIVSEGRSARLVRSKG